MQPTPTGEVEKDQSGATGVKCRFCATAMPPSASYCNECKHFQRTRDRLLGDINLQALVTLVPIATLAFAFLNQTVVFPYSKLSASVSRCSRNDVVLALSNSGTRTAIVDGGAATFLPAKADYNRSLRPPGDAFTPVVVKPGEAMVTRFAFVDANGEDALPAPQLQEPEVCRFTIALSTLEFGGRRAIVNAGDCRC